MLSVVFVMARYEGVEVKFRIYYAPPPPTPALEEDEWSAPHSRRFTPVQGPSEHNSTRGWVGPRIDLDVATKRNILASTGN